VHNGSVVIPVLANDDNPSGATLTIAAAPSHGTAFIDLLDHTIRYTSVGAFTGIDHFTYQVCDSAGTCASAAVSVHVLAPDQKQTDFTGVDLAGANLQGVDLSNNATLAGLDLAGANLTNANLTKTDVSDADLTGANLTNANLNATDLSRTDLTQAVLTQAKLQNADLTNATLAGLNLSGRDLTGADLSGADLSGTNFSHANLNNVTVTNATNLTGTNLTGVTGGPPPKIAPGTATTTTGQPVTFDVLSLVTDAKAPIKLSSLAITAQPTHGSVVLHPDGTATYTPAGTFTGDVTFTITVANVLTFTATGPVRVHVNP
jgi:uncharacterized protein YjbI with pentapeptide repeats